MTNNNDLIRKVLEQMEETMHEYSNQRKIVDQQVKNVDFVKLSRKFISQKT